MNPWLGTIYACSDHPLIDLSPLPPQLNKQMLASEFGPSRCWRENKDRGLSEEVHGPVVSVDESAQREC